MEVKKKFAYFSAAIREGAKLREQAFCFIFADGRTCSFGAGVDALGIPLPDKDDTGAQLRAYSLVEEMFPYLETRVNCAACNYLLEESLSNVIWHLNDTHKWSREAVADWLFEQEERLGFTTLVESEPSLISTQDTSEQFEEVLV